MNWSQTDGTLPGRRQTVAAFAYVSLIIALAASCLWLLNDFWTRSGEVAAAEARLDQIAKNSRLKPPISAGLDPGAAGSPFLDGPTITIAGAALQQRVGAAVTKEGGTVMSSQVEFDGAEAKNGFVYLTASFEASQPALQMILYDIEAGMPYLFVDKLSIQSAEDVGEQESSPMRMSITVSGQWRPAP